MSDSPRHEASPAVPRGVLAAGVLLVLVLATLVYWPGLRGGFLFDDFYNLAALGRGDGMQSLPAVLGFVFGNDSGVLGRPLAMLSFLADARHWPADPFPFKRTGLLLHLLCGLLWMALAARLLHTAGRPPRQVAGIALLAGAFWLLHPLQVSTVLYVIQRQAVLASLCVLAGLLLYLHGRRGAARSRWGNLLWMAGGFGLGTGLGVLAKESAVLMGAYVLAIEWVLAGRLPRDRLLVWAARLMAAAPLLAVAAYAALTVPPMAETVQAVRGWGVGERLLTQPRVLLDYLGQVAWPRVDRMGLAQDDWIASRGLWQPPATLFALLAWLGLLGLAVAVRRRWPFVALAVAWFLAGHALEASVFPLELYFEHRNYLPLAGPALLLAVAAVEAGAWLARRGWPRARWLPVAAPVLALLLLTYPLTSLWGNTLLLQASWMQQHPQSPRARINLAHVLNGVGDPDAAYRLLVDGFRAMPGRMDFGVLALVIECRSGVPAQLSLDDVLRDGHIALVSFDLYGALNSLARARRETGCEAVASLDALDRLFERVASDPRVQRNRLFLQRLRFDQADLQQERRDFEKTLHALELAYRALPSLDVSLRLAVTWATAGQYPQSWRWLRVAREHDAARRRFTPSRAPELDKLAQALEARLAAGGQPLPDDGSRAAPPYVLPAAAPAASPSPTEE